MKEIKTALEALEKEGLKRASLRIKGKKFLYKDGKLKRKGRLAKRILLSLLVMSLLLLWIWNFSSGDLLFEAVDSGSPFLTGLSLFFGANVNANYSGWTPLHEAAYWGRTEIAKLLLSHGADVNAKDNFGWTPLHKAAEEGKTEITKVLLSHGADVNARDWKGWTPLHWAAKHGNTEVAKILLSHGANPNAKTTKENWPFSAGSIPLHMAAKEGRTEVAKLLLSHGAEVNAKTPKDASAKTAKGWGDIPAGSTPLDIAKIKGNDEMVSLLRSHGGRCNTTCRSWR